jgi:glycosyltransferase involved in cell wall biosynthesis
VGRLDAQQKRPHKYLDLAKAVPDAEFLLIGPDGQDQEYVNSIRKRAASLDNVTDLGRVDPDEIHDFYRDGIALVNTSSHEGFPNTFLEAWRYNTPVVSLAVDPNRFVAPDIDGYAENDEERLISIVEKLHRDHEYRQTLGEPAGEFVRSELSIDTVAERYAGVLIKAMENTGESCQVTYPN